MLTLKPDRCVIKVGSSSLTDAATGILSTDRIGALAEQVARVWRGGHTRAILVSSGAVAAGRGLLGWRQNLTMPEKQAAAAVGQGLLIDAYRHAFSRYGIPVGQVLLTRTDIEDRRRFVNIRNTLETLLRSDVLPVVNENDTVAVEEIRFGENDTLAALVALLTDAGRLLLLTDIDGLYTANPRTDDQAAKIADVQRIDDRIRELAGGEGSAVGSGGMRTKIAAAQIATASGVDVVVASSTEPDVIVRALAGEAVGTHFHPYPGRRPARESWVLHGSRPEGRITVDAGAAAALRHRGGSLLIPGVVSVTGDFDEGAIVEIRGLPDHPIGKGIVNLAARDLRDGLERRAQGEDLRGWPEVVHRNDLALQEPGEDEREAGPV